MSDHGKERLAKWTQRLADSQDEDATKAVIQEIGNESVRLTREGRAMGHLYSGLVDLAPIRPTSKGERN